MNVNVRLENGTEVKLNKFENFLLEIAVLTLLVYPPLRHETEMWLRGYWRRGRRVVRYLIGGSSLVLMLFPAIISAMAARGTSEATLSSTTIAVLSIAVLALAFAYPMAITVATVVSGQVRKLYKPFVIIVAIELVFGCGYLTLVPVENYPGLLPVVIGITLGGLFFGFGGRKKLAFVMFVLVAFLTFTFFYPHTSQAIRERQKSWDQKAGEEIKKDGVLKGIKGTMPDDHADVQVEASTRTLEVSYPRLVDPPAEIHVKLLGDDVLSDDGCDFGTYNPGWGVIYDFPKGSRIHWSDGSPDDPLGTGKNFGTKRCKVNFYGPEGKTGKLIFFRK